MNNLHSESVIEKKFTQGKWIKSPQVRGSIASEDGGLICSMWQPEDSPERGANEKLITSAPELLDAVEEAMVFIEFFFTEGVTASWAADLERSLKKIYDQAIGRTEPQKLYGESAKNGTKKIKFPTIY